MDVLVYDESFEGFLTAVFEVYEYKLPDVTIVKQSICNATIFGQQRSVVTDDAKAKRVWKGLHQHISKEAVTALYHTWLSEVDNVEQVLLQYMRYAFSKKESIETDFSHPAVLTVAQTIKKVHREKHRMEAFIRFQLTKDGLYYAVIEPDYNVIPLLSKHFKNRYADQRWLIYDTRRKYGIHYNLEEVSFVQLTFSEGVKGNDINTVYDEQEELYQSLWQQYFKSVNIKARKNIKLHIQHMPRRYWKYLVEKKG